MVDKFDAIQYVLVLFIRCYRQKYALLEMISDIIVIWVHVQSVVSIHILTNYNKIVELVLRWTHSSS